MDSDSHPDSHFGFLVADVARMLREQFNTTAKAVGLTLAQARVLVHLSRNEGISQVALAGLLEIQPITLLRQIDRLAEMQLLERRPNPHDRRAQQLYLTEHAAPLIERIFHLAESLKSAALADIDEPERRHLISTLMHIKSNLANVAGQNSEEAPTTPTGSAGQHNV